MKILLFGGAGQLGWEVRARALDLNFEVVAPIVTELDINNYEQVIFLADHSKPDVIINCAAYTAVDKAEVERDLAFAINLDGTRNVARAASKVGCRAIHVSTDYVFSGDGSVPLKESDQTGPQGVYGESKLAGELALHEELGERGLVVRTSSLHGRHGENFVHTMIKLFSEREVVKVVTDQWMSPTWAGWLAEALLDLTRIDCGGIIHASGSGGVSWFDFAAAILESIKPSVPNAARVRLETTTAAEFARPAPRPRYSVFDCSKLTSVLGRAPISWQDGLRNHLAELGHRE